MAEPIDNKCIHCGEDCGKYPVVWEDKIFCCHGCKTVFQLLNQNKLFKYYEIENSPGVRIDKQELGNKYAFLDLDEIMEKVLDFSEGDISKVTLFIPSIHCSSCIWLLENMHQLNRGVKSSLVNFTKKEVSVTFNHNEISLRELVELLASIHYIPQINLDKLDGKQGDASNKKLLVKIGIAGFAFGNIMLLSMPEYLSIGEDIGRNFRDFFGYVNILLSLPVLIYSSNEYWLSAFKNLRHKMINIDMPITLGVFALFFQSLFEIVTGTGAGYLDSFAGFIFFLLIGKWYQNKTYQALAFDRDYKSYFPIAVSKITEDGEVSTPLKNLQVGDRILIRNQELIPTDGIIAKGHGNIDYSFVSGESNPLSKGEGDVVFAGGKQIGSALEIEIKKDVSQSQLTQLWNQHINQEKRESKINSIIDRLSKNFTILVLVISSLTAIYWYIFDPSIALMAFTSVLIVACPCAIALSLPFTFGTTMRIFGHKGFYLKNTDVVERLTKIDTVVFDKTGTITYSRSKNVKLEEGTLSEKDRVAIRSTARQSAHPLSAAVFDFFSETEIVEVGDFMEIPSAGIKAMVDGRMIRLGSREFILKEKDDDDAFAAEVYVSIDHEFKARFTVKNKYRKGIERVIDSLKKAYSLHVISGDNDAERKPLTELYGSADHIHFNQSPNDKLDYIAKLKQGNRNVLMIGDGLNDAGALNMSHVGISIADDVYQFSPACDAILEAKQFDKLVDFIHFSKTALKVVKTSFVISILYNLAGLNFAVQGLLSPIVAAILMPLSSVSVVTFVTFSTRWLARRKLRG
ncbi:MAG: heavy metal translocating P-type ATPase metal-binding domain-containing protein [Bacteroidales bacterium]|nr:heavy metal translocating P-type ATPase metal-binding domain-containing protein [Bacteroidales bacterium]MCF8457355.1 heavy metal translocating P-type ATPase metal-binding domain-containing protein [Bacteroidales bacterium]